MNELIARINNFDSYYEMSDSFQVIERGSVEKHNIQRLLEQLNKEEFLQLEESLTDIGLFNFKRYFI